MTSALRSGLRLVVSTALVVLLAVIFFLVGALIVAPKVMGWVPLTVLTGSMEPHIPVGSEVVVAPIEDPQEHAALRVGDVISYLPYPGDPTLITHRIVDIDVYADGRRSYVTQGDANAGPDPNPVASDQVRGVVKYHVPLIGHLVNVIPQAGKNPAILILGIALVGYALWEVAAWVRTERRAARRAPRHGASATRTLSVDALLTRLSTSDPGVTAAATVAPPPRR